MQNKANFRKSQMNVNPLAIMNYEEKSNWTLGENKPKQSQFRNRRQNSEDRKQMTAKSGLTKEYEEKSG